MLSASLFMLSAWTTSRHCFAGLSVTDSSGMTYYHNVRKSLWPLFFWSQDCSEITHWYFLRCHIQFTTRVGGLGGIMFALFHAQHHRRSRVSHPQLHREYICITIFLCVYRGGVCICEPIGKVSRWVIYNVFKWQLTACKQGTNR